MEAEMAKRSEIADTLVEAIGLEGAQRLVREYGGKQIKIPDGSGRAGAFSAWLDEALGIESARILRATFGGECITVPMLYDQMLAARNRLIIADYDGSLSMLDLVRKYQLSERQIRTILNSPVGDSTLGRQAVDDRQLGLF
jgi:hypothetical protein